MLLIDLADNSISIEFETVKVENLEISRFKIWEHSSLKFHGKVTYILPMKISNIFFQIFFYCCYRGREKKITKMLWKMEMFATSFFLILRAQEIKSCILETNVPLSNLIQDKFTQAPKKKKKKKH